MNIGIVTTWFERGAAYVSRQYRELLLPSNNVFIYARGGEFYARSDPKWEGTFVTWGKKSVIPVATAIDKNDFLMWITKNNIEIVFFNEQHWWFPIIWCNKLGIKTGIYIDYYTEETIQLFRAYDFIICNTKRHYSVFDWHPRSFYVPWGTDIKLYSPSSLKLVEEGMVTFFHSAGMSPDRKGCDLVIKAFAKISGEAKLVIHSQENLKNYFPQLSNLITDLEKRKRLVIIEQTISAPGLYHKGDVYVYPSRLEGIGLTIAEALACGLPVITSDNPPMNEFIDGTNGKIVKLSKLYSRSDGYYWPQCEVDLNSLEDCMQYYVDNRINIPAMKRQARLFAENNLDWLKNKSKILEIFHSAPSFNDEGKKESFEKILKFENKRNCPFVKLVAKYSLINRIVDILSKYFRKYFYSIGNL